MYRTCTTNEETYGCLRKMGTTATRKQASIYELYRLLGMNIAWNIRKPKAATVGLRRLVAKVSSAVRMFVRFQNDQHATCDWSVDYPACKKCDTIENLKHKSCAHINLHSRQARLDALREYLNKFLPTRKHDSQKYSPQKAPISSLRTTQC